MILSRSLLPSFALALAFVAVATGCGGATHKTRLARTQPPPEYRVGVDDILEIVVWKEPGLSTTVPVRPDGRISVPLAGQLQARGRTANELEAEIAERLKKTITSPVVSVMVKEIHATQVFVLGEVAQPGVYPLRGGLTVLQALAVAGGLTEFADRGDIFILRRDAEGRAKKVPFDYRDALSGDEPLELEPGDTIVVP